MTRSHDDEPATRPVEGADVSGSEDTLKTSVQRNSRTVAESPFEPGTIVAARYKIVRWLNRGGMSEIFLADDLKLGLPVALKVLAPEMEADPGWLDRFLDEVRIARRLSHPNICRVYDVGEAHGRHFLTMEHIDGEDLAILIDVDGRLPLPRAVEVATEICHGLAAIHDSGILHRDLKPANVILDRKGGAHIADFGLAALAGSIEAEDVMSGTPAYMAPEQHAGKEVTLRSDLYMLGMVLYELFTGVRPFPGKSRPELARLHATAVPEPPSRYVEDLDPAIERVILRCLEKDPGARPASTEAVLAALTPDAGVSAGEALRTLVVSDLASDAEAAAVAAKLLEEYGGLEVESADGPIWLFERPWTAVRFALGYQKALMEDPPRLGAHLGEVRLERRDTAPQGWAAEGTAVSLVGQLMSLAQPGQTLLTRFAFDLARQGAGQAEFEELQWLAHGSFHFAEGEEKTEVFEVGIEGEAPLLTPAGTHTIPAALIDDAILGWRPAPGLLIPKRFSWKVARRLGEGGFGEVWLAQDVKTHERRVFKFCWDAVALQALRREIALFRLLKEELGERRDIVRILDWSFEKPPFFIESEYVAEGDLGEWATAQGGLLSIPMEVRLEIVAQVAEALAAAHSVGVLHKDVKPGNVLIVPEPESAAGVRAQLSDFGIGRVTERDRLTAVGITAVGWTEALAPSSYASSAGTRLYLAPEELEGKAPTLQADVYSLGVLLFQMVVGDFSRALAPGWREEIEDRVLAEDVAAAVHGSPARRISGTELAERLRTLEERRANRLAREKAKSDAERARRHRRMMVAAIAVLAVFGGILAALLVQVDRARTEAEQEAEAARQVSDFLVDLFQVNDPFSTSNVNASEVTAREILERGAKRLSTELTEQPEIRARLLGTIAEVYSKLGISEAAEASFRESLALQRQELGDDHPDTVETVQRLAWLLQYKGDYAEAESLYREALDWKRKHYGDAHRDVADALCGLAWVVHSQGRYDEAEPFYREGLAALRKLTPGDSRELASCVNDYALLLQAKGDYDGAEPLYREALAMRRRLFGDQHPFVAYGLNNLGWMLYSKGDYDAAEPLLRESAELVRKKEGRQHPGIAYALSNLAAVQIERGEPAEAEALSREAVELFRQNFPGHWRIANSESILGASLAAQGRFEEAEKLLLGSYPIVRDTTGESSKYTEDVLRRLVRLYEAWGRPDDAGRYRALLDGDGS